MQEGSETVETVSNKDEEKIVTIEISWIGKVTSNIFGTLPRKKVGLTLKKSLTKKEEIALSKLLVQDGWEIENIETNFAKSIIEDMRVSPRPSEGEPSSAVKSSRR